MRIRALPVSVVLSALLLAIAGLGAQSDPFHVLEAGDHLLVAPRGPGTITTLLKLPPSSGAYRAITPYPGDDSLLVFQENAQALNVHQLQRIGPRGFVTLATYRMTGGAVDMDLDDAGDARFLWTGGKVPDGIYTAPQGGSNLTLTASWPAGASYPVAFAEDRASGSWIAVDYNGWIHWLDRSGARVTSLARVGTTPMFRRSGLESDPLTGDFLIPSGDYIYRFDPVLRILTTAYTVPSSASGGWLTDVKFDPATRGFVFCGFVFIMGNGYYGFTDARLRPILFRDSRRANGMFEDIVPTYGRRFEPLSAPIRGATYQVRLHLRGEGLQLVQAAFAFRHIPGIPTPAGVIPLYPDALFWLSLGPSPLFRNLGGRLDGTGRKTVEMILPALPPIRGLRVHLAGITFDGTGIRTIFGPHSFTVR